MNKPCTFCELDQEVVYEVEFIKNISNNRQPVFKVSICDSCFQLRREKFIDLGPHVLLLEEIEATIGKLNSIKNSNPEMFREVVQYFKKRRNHIRAMIDRIEDLIEEENRRKA